MVYIRFVNQVKIAMIKHALEVPDKECGGFLYGNILQKNNDIICDIEGIYYERKFGSDCEFNFGLSYINNAKNVLKQLKSQLLLGTYHSHGIYPAVFSEIDRNELQKYFGPNKVTMIYSPAYSTIIGEFMDDHGKSHRAKIITR